MLVQVLLGAFGQQDVWLEFLDIGRDSGALSGFPGIAYPADREIVASFEAGRWWFGSFSSSFSGGIKFKGAYAYLKLFYLSLGKIEQYDSGGNFVSEYSARAVGGRLSLSYRASVKFLLLYPLLSVEGMSVSLAEDVGIFSKGIDAGLMLEAPFKGYRFFFVPLAKKLLSDVSSFGGYLGISRSKASASFLGFAGSFYYPDREEVGFEIAPQARFPVNVSKKLSVGVDVFGSFAYFPGRVNPVRFSAGSSVEVKMLAVGISVFSEGYGSYQFGSWLGFKF